MKYPVWLKKGDWIGVTACSDGKPEEVEQIRMDSAKEQFLQRGFFIKETNNVRTSERGRSSVAQVRAKELLELVEDKEVAMVLSASGGDYLMEVLPLIDYKKIAENPKWYQGYSDPTGLLYTITTHCDLATVYGGNYGDFGMRPWHPSLEQNLQVLQGELKLQESFSAYTDGFIKKITGYETYREDLSVYWKADGDKTEISGRLLGGCLDVLLDLVGTRFDKTKEWIQNYKEDGILWYLESFALDGGQLTRGLWQLKEAGWFQYAKGFVFGRPTFFNSDLELSYEETVKEMLAPLGVPIVFEADFGHKPPRMTIINGAYGVVTVENGKGTLLQQMK